MSSIEIHPPLQPPTTALVAATVREEPSNITMVLDQLCRSVSCEVDGEERVSFGDILATVGRRSYGPLILLIGLFALSPLTVVPGMTWFAATVTLLVAAQMLIGRRNPWLPNKALAITMPRRLLVKGVDKARPVAKAVDLLLKPRLTFLTQPPLVNLVGALLVLAALVTYPLGFVPAGPFIPSLAVTLFGLGITARDGLLLTAATALVGLAGWGLLSLPVPF